MFNSVLLIVNFFQKKFLANSKLFDLPVMGWFWSWIFSVNNRLVELTYHLARRNFNKTHATPPYGLKALIQLYCYTNGKFCEEQHHKMVSHAPPVYSEEVEGFLGKYSSHELAKINLSLEEEGYYKFETRLEEKECQRIFEFAESITAHVPGQSDKINYDRKHIVSEIYRIDSLDIIKNKTVQQLIMDPTLIEFARRYLKSEPIFDFPAMWWSTSVLQRASEEAAQNYHFDLDRVKWLKVFFYINDVDESNGPHCYIKGTHKSGSKPDEILSRGYNRIPDEVIEPYYASTDIKVLTGKRGSVFLGDTMAWHKGTALKSGERLVLEFQYTCDLFGANFPKYYLTKNDVSSEFQMFLNENSFYTQRISVL